jgi:ubiquinone/menaquinone biosynthesis C-methylase UbiE
MSSRPAGYVPAAGHDWLLPLYDPLLRFVLREDRMRREILAQLALPPRARVLDLGCGTGTQAVLTKRAHPDAEVVGLDGDEKALAIARGKAAKAGVDLALDEGLATALPYSDARFDRVISSFVFHHLDERDKQRAAREVRRVLAPGGFFLLVDFGAPVTRIEHLAAHLFGHAEHAKSQLEGGVPALLRDAGFTRVEELSQRSLGFARVWTWRATA